MANRTVQLLGQGYGANPAQITVTANGTTVFSGAVTTVDQPLPSLPNTELNVSNILCSFEIDLAFSGQIPMTCAVSAGPVLFANTQANYVKIPNPVYTSEQSAILLNPATPGPDRLAIYTQVANPPLSEADITVLKNPATTPEQRNEILLAHNCSETTSSGANVYGGMLGDARSSASIDGIPQTQDHDALPGTWWYLISSGSTLTYQMYVDPATI